LIGLSIASSAVLSYAAGLERIGLNPESDSGNDATRAANSKYFSSKYLFLSFSSVDRDSPELNVWCIRTAVRLMNEVIFLRRKLIN
jgi:hypothetical protein